MHFIMNVVLMYEIIKNEKIQYFLKYKSDSIMGT